MLMIVLRCYDALSGKEVLTFREDVMIHLKGYTVQELDPKFGGPALRNVGSCLSQ